MIGVFILASAPNRSDMSEDDEEIDDQDVQKIIIVTQTPPAFKKHPGGDRTGQSYNRSKLTADIAEAINIGLYFYEQVALICPFMHAFSK